MCRQAKRGRSGSSSAKATRARATPPKAGPPGRRTTRGEGVWLGVRKTEGWSLEGWLFLVVE
ncbi:hypothetical protein T484DRAFT_1901491 [Baffinella frigidus]|nr:hypothetical protein T484DRAFT_1901491 [Cryptophyta sp. CCMP2293]